MRSSYDIALPQDVDLRVLVNKAYDLSNPQGMGIFHYTSKPLTEEETDTIVNREFHSSFNVISMDYIKGRSLKFHVRRDEEGMYVGPNWYDHSTRDYIELLGSVGIPEQAIHDAQAALDKANAEYLAQHA